LCESLVLRFGKSPTKLTHIYTCGEKTLLGQGKYQGQKLVPKSLSGKLSERLGLIFKAMTNLPAVEMDLTENIEGDNSSESFNKIPYIDLTRQNTQYKYEIKMAINRVLESGIYTSGPETEKFESEFAALNRAPYCIGVSSGSEALEIGLRALGVIEGDGVLTVANAGMHSTSVIRDIGAIPQFVEIDPDTLTMSPERLANAITPQSRVVILTHLYGRVADINALQDIADQHDLPLVEDCFQANGATLDGKNVGTWGAVGCFCFSPTKNLGTLGEAGGIITHDKKIADKAREIRRDGSSRDKNSYDILGKPSLMNEIQAAVLRAKLPMLEVWNLRRRMIAQTYNIHLDSSNSKLHCEYPSDGSVFQLFVVQTSQRDHVQDHLKRKGIGSAVHYPIPDHLQKAGMNASYPRSRLPETEKACAEVLSLPCYPELSSWEVEQVCAAVNESLANF
jgi:dTDP-4-amino-4,6-dideoxygalactose transaminase